MLHQRLTHSGSFAFWEACAEESPGHVFALSGSQMAQLDGLFGGSGVRTAVTAIIYTSDGDAESLACTTCDPAPFQRPPQPLSLTTTTTTTSTSLDSTALQYLPGLTGRVRRRYVASAPGAAAPTAAVGQGHTADATQPPRIEGGEEGMDAL